MTTQAETNKRRNLAFDLLDQDARKAYLHPRTHSLASILRRMYRPVLKEPKIVAAQVGFALTAGILPILSVFIVYYPVQLISQTDVTARQVLLSSGIYAVLFLLCSVVSLQLENRNYSFFNHIRMRTLDRCLEQYMRMDFGIYENASFLDDVGNWNRSLSNNSQGLEGTYHEIFKMGGTMVSALLLGLILARVNPLIFIAGIGFVAVYYLTRANISSYQHNRREELHKVSRRTGHLAAEASDFRYGKDVRLFGMQERFAETFRPLLKIYEGLYRAFTLREFQLSFVESAALVAIDIVSLVVLARQLLAGNITLPVFVMLLTGVTLFMQTMQELGRQLAFVKDETLYVGDMFDFLDADLQSSGGGNEVPGTGPVEIVFEAVSFHYPGNDKLVLENMDLTLRPGESYALVGVNGAGKTTLVKLLTGLYQPTGGRILVNGVDAATIPQEELFSLFGVVFQEVQPLALTVAENVAGTDKGIDRSRVEACLRTAGLWEKIESLDKGIDTPMLKVIEDDGIILSGGENQKLAIARALYRENTRMLVLDEPTAALDALAEEKIYREFGSLLDGRTALFISHRLASTRFCDHIVLLDGGRITQQGTHDELMKEDGLYRHMFETQGKYYQNNGTVNSAAEEEAS